MLQTGNIDWSMAQMVQEHGNKRMENEFSMDAQSDYELAVKLNPDDPDSRYKLAVAMENLGHFADAGGADGDFAGPESLRCAGV